MNEKKIHKDKRNKYDQWPKGDRLKDALETFDKFRAMCQLEMELGYWATATFPSKHHINRILSLQYLDKEALILKYGEGLINRVFETIPYCKHYVMFVRELGEINE